MQENNKQAEPTKAVSNGRNKRRCSNKVSNAVAQAPVCGLVEDTSIFTEKLSGQHNKGYENNQAKAETPATPVADEASECCTKSAEQTEETQENSQCCCSKEESPKETESTETESTETSKEESYTGPSFEETKNPQKRTLEVSLKKVPHKSEKVVEKDAVSYSKVSASMGKEKPKKGVMSKIRAFFSKLFGKKSKKNSRNFKNNRGGYRKNYSKGQKRNNFDKNGSFDKPRDGNRPNNNRRKNYNRRPNYNSNKPKAPATKE